MAAAESRRELRGSFDGVIGRLAYGWALDPDAPDRPLRVEVLDRASGRMLGCGWANQPRDDLLRLGIGHGCCAFRIVLAQYPPEAADLVIRLPGAHLLLPSPKVWPRAPQPTAGMRPWPPAGFRQRRLAESGPRPVLLVLSLIDWSFRFQRPQQLGLALEQLGYGVVYVDAGFHGADWSDAEGRPLPACQALTPDLWRVALAQPPSGPVSIAVDLEADAEAGLADQLRRLRALDTGGALLALVMHPAWFPLLQRAWPELPLVYDCMDLLSGFPETTQQQLVLEELLLERCQLAVASSADLYRRLPRGRRAVVRNGCDLAHFAVPSSFASCTRWPLVEVGRSWMAVVGYYGAIASWFAIELLADVAQRLPDHLFLLGGSSEGCDLSAVIELNNVVFLGELPYGELPAFLARCAVAIIPFRLDPLIQATNPVKLYEYLAAGKPVVATPLPEIQRLKLPAGCCRLASDAAGFAAAIQAMESGDGPELQAERRRYASRHSWQQRARCYDAILKGLLAPRTAAMKAAVPDRQAQRDPWPQLLRQSLEAGDWPVAEGVLRHLLDQRPGHPAHLDLLGYALFMQGRYSASEQVLRKALAAGSRQFWTPHKLGDALRAQQRQPEAIGAYEQALAWGSDSPLTVRNLLLSCAQHGDPPPLQRLAQFAGGSSLPLDWLEPAPWQLGAQEACLQLGSSVLAAWLVEAGCPHLEIRRLAWRESLARLELTRLLEWLGPQPPDAASQALQQRLTALLALA